MKKRFQILDSFVLKVIAMVTMTFDHLGVYLDMYVPRSNTALLEFAEVCRYIGRLAFPLFVFMLVEGMVYTRNAKKYALRIGLVALSVLVAHVAVTIFFYLQDMTISLGGNPLIELFMLALMLACFKENGTKKALGILPIIYILLSYGVGLYEYQHNHLTVAWFPEYLRADYSLFGLLICLGFYVARPLTNLLAKRYQPAGLDLESFKTTTQYRGLLNIVSTLNYVTIILIIWLVCRFSVDASGFAYLDSMNISWESWAILSSIFILMYNGKRGYDSKWFRLFSYSYFPLHLIILCIIFVAIYGL